MMPWSVDIDLQSLYFHAAVVVNLKLYIWSLCSLHPVRGWLVLADVFIGVDHTLAATLAIFEDMFVTTLFSDLNDQ